MFRLGGHTNTPLLATFGETTSLGSFQQTKEEYIKSSAYVVHTLEAAL